MSEIKRCSVCGGMIGHTGEDCISFTDHEAALTAARREIEEMYKATPLKYCKDHRTVVTKLNGEFPCCTISRLKAEWDEAVSVIRSFLADLPSKKPDWFNPDTERVMRSITAKEAEGE